MVAPLALPTIAQVPPLVVNVPSAGVSPAALVTVLSRGTLVVEALTEKSPVVPPSWVIATV